MCIGEKKNQTLYVIIIVKQVFKKNSERNETQKFHAYAQFVFSNLQSALSTVQCQCVCHHKQKVYALSLTA